MAIKKVTFSFDVPITQLLGLIASGGADLKIDVYGDHKPPKAVKLLNGHAPKLLEGPKRGGRKTRGTKTAYRALFDALAAQPDLHFKPVQLQPAVVECGLSEKSVSPQLTKLRQDGNVKRHGDGTYQITTKGVAAHARLIAEQANA